MMGKISKLKCPVCGKELDMEKQVEVESGNPVTKGAWDFICEDCGNSGIIDLDGKMDEK